MRYAPFCSAAEFFHSVFCHALWFCVGSLVRDLSGLPLSVVCVLASMDGEVSSSQGGRRRASQAAAGESSSGGRGHRRPPVAASDGSSRESACRSPPAGLRRRFVPLFVSRCAVFFLEYQEAIADINETRFTLFEINFTASKV